MTKIFEKKKYICIKYSYLGIAKDEKPEWFTYFEKFNIKITGYDSSRNEN